MLRTPFAMTTTPRWRITLLLGGTLAGAACGGASRAPAGAPPVPTPGNVEALYRARLDSAMTRFTPAT